MLQLRSLQQQLDDLRSVFDKALEDGKTLEQVRDTYMQMKELQKLIYERKVYLKSQGLFEETIRPDRREI